MQNKYVRDSITEASIMEKIRENRPSWFEIDSDEERWNGSGKSGFKNER